MGSQLNVIANDHYPIHGRSNHGYIPEKNAGQGHFGQFWSLRLV